MLNVMNVKFEKNIVMRTVFVVAIKDQEKNAKDSNFLNDENKYCDKT